MFIKQKNYAKIEEKNHDNHDRFKLSDKKFRKPDKLDKIIVREIINILDRKKNIKNFRGEWEYINQKKRSDFIKALENLDIQKLEFKFANLFKTDASYGLVTPPWNNITNVVSYKSQILRDIDSAIEFEELKNLKEISLDKRIGNPYGLAYKKQNILPDSPRHYYFAKKINKLLLKKSDLKFLEIGGGYGGLIKLIFNKKKFKTIYSLDLFEGCLIQYYFLRKNNLKVNFVLNPKDFKNGQINLIPYFKNNILMNSIPKCNVVFNSRSFSEMDPKILKNYLNLINKKYTPNLLYHENSNYLLFPNSKRHVEVLGKDFNLLKKYYFLKYINISPFSGGSGRYREFVYYRKNKAESI